MKRSKIIGIILFILSIVSLPIGFSLSCIIGEADIFGIAGILRYSWILYLFIPICILSAFYGKHLKNNGLPYKKNYIAAVICLSFLLIFGSYRFIFSNTTYDTTAIKKIEQESNFGLPDEIKIATIKFDQYNVSYVKILDEQEKNYFDRHVTGNPFWKNKMSDTLNVSLPMDIQLETKNFDYFAVYDVINKKHNPSSLSNNCEFIFIAYDSEIGRFIIFDGSRA